MQQQLWRHCYCQGCPLWRALHLWLQLQVQLLLSLHPRLLLRLVCCRGQHHLFVEHSQPGS